MTIIPDIYAKIGTVLDELRKRSKSSFSTVDFYDLYIKRYPGDVDKMELRKRENPKAHSLKGYLNGMVPEYANRNDKSDGPTIAPDSEMTFRFTDDSRA